MKNLKIASVVFWLVYFGMMALMMIGCLSCNTAKQATKHANKSLNKNPVAAAKVFRDKFPCITTYRDTGSVVYKPGKIDTVSKPQLVKVPCPDNSPGAKPGATIPTLVEAPCNCEERTPDTAYIPVNNYIRDSADVFIIKKETDKLKKELSALESGKKLWRVLALVFIGLFVLAIILIVKKVKIF